MLSTLNSIQRGIVVVILLAIALNCKKKAINSDHALAFATTVMQDVLPAMVKTLQEKVTQEGAAAAVPFCHEYAPSFGKKKNAEWSTKAQTDFGASTFRIRRISPRNRNPQNTTDARQAAIFAKWQQDGARPIFYENAGKYYTMHPIKIAQPMCLSCHGDKTQVDQKTAQEIQRLYPQDKATGYQVGDLRGAFLTEMTFSR
jgi:Tol biopolymer transport system component